MLGRYLITCIRHTSDMVTVTPFWSLVTCKILDEANIIPRWTHPMRQ